MKKETLADKLAKKTFFGKDFQKSWAVHMQAFGPILEPAFAENYQARVHLTAALNRISQRDIRGGMEKLKGLQKYCETNADKAAWLFFMGVACEVGGAKEQMISCYQQAGTFGHRFYMPYLKVAKAAHGDAVYEIAEKNYRAAIHCFDGAGLGDQEKIILASAYTNLGNCLVMMHRYEEAAATMDTAEQILPGQRGMDAARALLYAVKQETDKADACLARMEETMPAEVTAETRKMVEAIVKGEHPHFTRQNVEADRVSAFWDWFAANQAQLAKLIRDQKTEEFFPRMQEKLTEVFPFLDRMPELGIQPEEDSITLTLADFYMVSLEHGYQVLLAACPEELKTAWKFEIAH